MMTSYSMPSEVMRIELWKSRSNTAPFLYPGSSLEPAEALPWESGYKAKWK